MLETAVVADLCYTWRDRLPLPTTKYESVAVTALIRRAHSSHAVMGVDRHSSKEGRDIGMILPFTKTNRYRPRRREEDNHEAQEVEEKDPATRETSA